MGCRGQPAGGGCLVDARICAIVGMQRSGTTALGRAIGAKTGCICAGEIFHAVRGPEDDPDHEKFLTWPQANFFRFRESLLGPRPALSYPSVANQTEIWTRYVDHLRSLTDATLIIIDVKCNSVHHLNPVWQDALGQPALFKLLRAAGTPLIHMRRGNLLAQTISEIVANKQRRWHAAVGEQITDQAVAPQAFNAKLVKQALLAKRNNIRHFVALLSAYPRRLNLDYETTFDSLGQIQGAVKDQLSALFNRDMSDIQTDLRKIGTPNVADMIANPAEILAAFQHHPMRADVAAWLSGGAPREGAQRGANSG
jgi:hypothetical protein